MLRRTVLIPVVALGTNTSVEEGVLSSYNILVRSVDSVIRLD